MVRCQYGLKKIKQDNCPRLSQSQSTAPCPLIHLSIIYEVAHKHSASKLASAFSGWLHCGTTSTTIKVFKQHHLIHQWQMTWFIDKYQIHCCTLKWTHISYCGTTDTPLKFSSSESELLFSLIITRLFPPSWSPACAAPSSQTVGRDCSVVEPSGRFVGERQHSSSRIASVAVAELVAATQHSSHSSSVCRCCRRRLTTRIAGAAALARSCVAQHSRGQQLLFQQLLILLCHGDSHVVTKIFPISTGLGL